LARARAAQEKIAERLEDVPPTDPKLTPKALKRHFPKRREFSDLTQLPAEKEVA
jgi:hypothetical protein